MKYLIQTVDTYRVATVADVERLHEDLQHNPNFDLVAFSYKTKYIKAQGEIVEEYQVVTAKKIFNPEKEPESSIDVCYTFAGQEEVSDGEI